MEEPLDSVPKEEPAGPSKGFQLAIRIENVLVSILMISILLNFLNIPGKGLINMAGWSLMSILYFAVWQLVIKAHDFGDRWSMLLVRATSFVLSLAFMAILFRLNNWPGGAFNLQSAAWPGAFLLTIAFGAKLVGNTIDPRAIIWVIRRLTPVMVYIALHIFLGISL